MSGLAPTRRVARDSLSEELIAAIVAWRLPPGQRLSEEWLATHLGVSRTPVREALLRLEGQRLVVRARSGQLVVAPVSEQAVRNVFSVRIALEAVAAREACENATAADHEVLEDILSRLDAALAVGQVTTAAGYGRQFHSAIHAASHNSMTLAFLETLQPHVDRYRFLTVLLDHRRAKEGERGHHALLRAVQGGDVELAATEMSTHLSKGREATINAVRRVLVDPAALATKLPARSDGDRWLSLGS